MTEEDVIRCVAKYGRVDIERLRPSLPRLLRQMRELGIDSVPFTTGSVSETHVLKHYLEISPDKAVRRKAHPLRNTLALWRLLGDRGWHYD